MHMAFAVNIVHIPINYLFIFVFHWSAAGAACGSLISTTAGTCYMLGYGFVHYRKEYPLFQYRHLNLSAVRKLAPVRWKVSWPEITMLFLVYFTDLVIVSFVAAYGTTEIAGIRILSNIENLMFTLIFACSIRESILISQCLGAQDIVNARMYLRKSLLFTAIIAGVIGLVMLFFPALILSIFTPVEMMSAFRVGPCMCFKIGSNLHIVAIINKNPCPLEKNKRSRYMITKQFWLKETCTH